MANDREITIVIRADGTAAIAGMRGVGDATEKLGTRTASLVQSFQKNWAAITAGVTGAYLAFQNVFTLMEQAAGQAERMETLASLTAHYGSTADQLVGTIQRVSRGLIGVGDAADVATDALAKGFTPEQVTQMAKYSETLAETSGRSMTTAQAFRELEEALIAGKEKGAVKLFGTMIDLEVALGKNAATLTKAQKAQELFNLAMAEGERRQKAFGDATDSVADKMERFNTQVADLKLNIGGFANSVAIALFGVVQSVAGSVSIIISAIVRLFEYSSKITDWLGITKGAAAEWGQTADALQASGEDLKKQAQANYELALGIGAKVPPRPVAPPPPPSQLSTEEEDKFTKISKIRFKTAEAYQKSYQAILAAVLKFKNDSSAIEEADAASFQKSQEAKIGALSAFYAESEVLRQEARVKQMDMDKADYENRLSSYRAAQEAMRESAQNAPLGADQIGEGLLSLLSISEGTDPFAQRTEQLRQHFAEVEELHRQNKATIEGMESAHNEWRASVQLQESTRELRVAGAHAQLMLGILELANTLTRGKYQALFYVIRGMQAAQAIISANVAAAAALAPPPIGLGPVAGIPLAGIVKAMGYVNAAAIMAQTFAGSAGAGGGGGGGSVSIPSLSSSASTTTAPEKKEASTSPVYNVYVYGNIVDHDAFARELIPSLKKASSDGVA